LLNFSLDGSYISLPFTTAALHQRPQKLYRLLKEQIIFFLGGGGARKIDESVFIDNPSAHANTHAQTHKDDINKFKESGGFL